MRRPGNAITVIYGFVTAIHPGIARSTAMSRRQHPARLSAMISHGIPFSERRGFVYPSFRNTQPHPYVSSSYAVSAPPPVTPPPLPVPARRGLSQITTDTNQDPVARLSCMRQDLSAALVESTAVKRLKNELGEGEGGGDPYSATIVCPVLPFIRFGAESAIPCERNLEKSMCVR